MKNRYIPKTRATIRKTIRQKRYLISPFPKTMAASSAKGLQMDKILNPPRDKLMMKMRISLQTVRGCRETGYSVRTQAGWFPTKYSYYYKILPKLTSPILQQNSTFVATLQHLVLFCVT